VSEGRLTGPLPAWTTQAGRTVFDRHLALYLQLHF